MKIITTFSVAILLSNILLGGMLDKDKDVVKIPSKNAIPHDSSKFIISFPNTESEQVAS